MTPDDRRRAGGAVAERMRELGLSIRQLAEKAEVDRSTIRSVIQGNRWPRESTKDRIVAALGWTPDEFDRRTWAATLDLRRFSTVELVQELCNRLTGAEGAHSAPHAGLNAR